MIHRFTIALADVDRGVYADLDVRVARHPSEDVAYLLTRVLAFALEHQEGLEFSRGLSDGDEPAVWAHDLEGRVREWIEVGAPAPERLHKASKLGARVVVYCHHRPDLLRERCRRERIHRGDEIVLVAVPGHLLEALQGTLERTNRWDLSVHEGLVTVVVDGKACEGEFARGPLLAV